MSLHHPALTTTGKKKGKVKWASAAHKLAAERLDSEWLDIQKRHGVLQLEKKQATGLAAKAYKPPVRTYRGSDEPKAPSLNTGWHTCAKPADKVYTGSAIVGISTLHKSNAVPVFSQEAAIDIARMRR